MKFVATASDGVHLAGETHGPTGAPTLLFLNSIGCDRRLWDAQIEALHDRFRCLVFDTRGHGDSQAPDGDYSIDRLTQDALAVLDTVEAATAHVCGLSLGGVVAQWLAIQAPERVDRLVLADTASRIGSAESWETRRLQVLEHGLSAIADLAMQRFFSEAFRSNEPAQIDIWRGRLLATSNRGYAGCCAALRDANLSQEASKIGAPTLVITGEFDVSTPVEQGQALADAVAAQFTVLKAGHLANLEQPAAFTAALLAHLEAA